MPSNTIRRSGRLRTLAVPGLALAVLCSAITASADTTPALGSSDPATRQRNAPPEKPAPKDFRAQLVEIYGKALEVSARYPVPGVTPPSRAAYAKDVAALTQKQLNQMYGADTAVWERSRSALAKILSVGTNRVRAQSQTSAEAAEPPQSGALALTQSGSTQLPSPPSLTPCDTSEAPALLITVGVLESTAQAVKAVQLIFPIELVGVVLGFGVNTPDPPYQILGVVYAALQVAQAGVQYFINEIEDCKAQSNLNVENWTAPALYALGAQLEAGVATIEQNQANTDAQIQTGFGNVETYLANLEASAAAAQQQLDEELTLDIESALAGRALPGDFELPASAGGYLDATPIGVRQIVTDALNNARALAQPVDATAPRDLLLANNALAAGRYKEAFHYYGLTYRDIDKA